MAAGRTYSEEILDIEERCFKAGFLAAAKYDLEFLEDWQLERFANQEWEKHKDKPPKK